MAAVLGGAHAAITALWLAGSTFLLDTVGGEIEAWGRQRSGTALGILTGVFLVKVVVATAALLYCGMGRQWLPEWLFNKASRPYTRRLGWCAAGVLTLYGGILTVVGLMVQTGLLNAAADADQRALAWHAYLWDPWFLAWGLALGACLHWTGASPAGTSRGEGGAKS